MDDEDMVRKADGYVDVLNSYLRALHSLSSEQRWKGAGTQLRGIGSRMDSVIYRYNILADKEDKLPEGYARMAGKVFGYVAEEVMQTVQSKAVRNVVMVAASCDSLMSILRSDEMNALIEHERESLGDNFSAWLSAMEMSGEAVSVSDMEAYVDLVRRADNLPAVRNRCVSALRSLKNAHASLAADLAAGETDLSADLYEELVRLNRLAAQVAGMLN
jgi:UDP-N-acetylglucosamine transferase subunit ALG13